MLASPQTKSSWSGVISSGGEAQGEGEESQTLPPSLLERTPTDLLHEVLWGSLQLLGHGGNGCD